MYESELEAAKAHDRAARFHFPDKSMTNFDTEEEADRVIAEQDEVRCGVVWRGVVWCGVGFGVVFRGAVEGSVVWGVAWCNVSWRSVACGVVRCGVRWRGAWQWTLFADGAHTTQTHNCAPTRPLTDGSKRACCLLSVSVSGFRLLLSALPFTGWLVAFALSGRGRRRQR